jgi:hypothetical protein
MRLHAGLTEKSGRRPVESSCRSTPRLQKSDAGPAFAVPCSRVSGAVYSGVKPNPETK